MTTSQYKVLETPGLPRGFQILPKQSIGNFIACSLPHPSLCLGFETLTLETPLFVVYLVNFMCEQENSCKKGTNTKNGLRPWIF